MTIASERHQAILRLLSEKGRVEISELARQFGISCATARRDAFLLADAGRAARIHGGLLPSNFFEGEMHFPAKAGRRVSTKSRLARCAVDLLPHQGDIFVDSGTTCLEVGRLLLGRPKLRIFTNSIPMLAFIPRAEATILCIGGESRKESLALTGALAQAWLAHINFDVAVVGASGLDLATGAYTTELHEAAVKAEVLRRSKIRVLVADAEKWNRPTSLHFAPWSAFTALVTDHPLPHDAHHRLALDDVKIHAI